MTTRARARAEAEGRFDRGLEATRAAVVHLDAVRLLMRESVDPASRGDVFDREVTGVTSLPVNGHPHNGH